MTAQGNALGNRYCIDLALKGLNKKRLKLALAGIYNCMLCPFRALGLKNGSPGRCPGLLCILLSGLKLHNNIWLGSIVPKDAYQIQYTFRLRSR
jgi:hypothetical protein